MNRIVVPATILLSCIWFQLAGIAQTAIGQKYPRAQPPDFSREEAARVFFQDVFSLLVGERPRNTPGSASDAFGLDEPAGTADTASEADSKSWSRVISPATLEDEIKSLKLQVDRIVTTPSSFAGLGHKTARLDFSLLAMLFAVIDQYDGEVRWKESASIARDLFARTASNLKAGGSIQVYNESKQRKQDLDDLVRGSRLPGRGSEGVSWDAVVERSPLMQLLESRFESNLKPWTANAAEFQARRDEVRHEAEMAAAIGAVLLSDGMDDADDEDYRKFAASLKQGGVKLVQAAKAKDQEAARQAMSELSRSCTDCHENYR